VNHVRPDYSIAYLGTDPRLASAQGISREPNAAGTAPNAQSPSAPKAGAQQRPDQSMPHNRGAERHGDSDRGVRQASPKDRDQTTGQAMPGPNSPAEPRGSERPNAGDTKRGQQTEPRGQDQKNQGAQRNQEQRNQGVQRGERDQPDQGARRGPEQPTQDTQHGQQPTDQTQGQGSHANISNEQRTRIRETIIKESNAPRVNNVNFNVSVGTVVPRTVRLAPVPVTFVEVVPAWRGYVYFIVGDDIIVVEPGTNRIVAVIAA
jgi:hypothetical protein